MVTTSIAQQLKDRETAVQKEIAERAVAIKVQEDMWHQREEVAELEYAKKRQEDEQERIRLEHLHNAEIEAVRLAKVEKRVKEKELNTLQYSEEQTKAVVKTYPVPVPSERVSHLSTSEPAEGTGGNTPRDPVMSDHLKLILRQT